MPRVRAIKSFVWALADRDVGEEFDVSERDAFLLIHGYSYCVPVDGPAPALPSATGFIVERDPAVEHRDPVVAKARKGRA